MAPGHGGAMFQLFPLVASSLRGFEETLPQMARFASHARELAAALTRVPGLVVVPDPPQTPLFHVHLTGEQEALQERALDVSQRSGVWLFETCAKRRSGRAEARTERRRGGAGDHTTGAGQLFSDVLAVG